MQLNLTATKKAQWFYLTASLTIHVACGMVKCQSLLRTVTSQLTIEVNVYIHFHT